MSGLLKSTAVFSSLTLISRILGFVRDMVFANLFGAGAATDAFFVAFKIPNFLRRLFAEGAFSQAFVPVLSEYKSLRSQAEVRLLVASVSGTLGSVLLLLTLLAVLGAYPLVTLFAPGFVLDADDGKYALTAQMLRITFPYLLFISLTALSAGILNSYGKFAVPAVTPVWLNLSLIGAAFWLSPHFEPSVVALAWGVFIAGVVQLLFQFPSLMRLGLLPRPRWGWRDEGVRRIMRLMLPAIFGSSVAQINLLFDTIIASFLVSGSVTWLYYSDRLVEFPLGVFGIALATVILPSLSQRHAEADPRSFSRTLDWALRWVLLIGVPAMLGLLLLAGPVLATLFQYGEFAAADVRMATLSLMAYSLGLLGFMLVKVLAPGFFARQDTRTPVRFAVYSLIANMLLNLLFVVPMALAGIPGPHAGLALATGLAAFVNAGLLFRRLRHDGVYRAEPGWGGFALRVVTANTLMALFLWWGRGPLADWFALDAAGRALQLAGLVGAAVAIYFAALLVLGIRPRQLLGKME
ncbi:MAG: murein biosynthesis integral membrane protein MurJ [Gammaproteobacteria bacterium]|nr:murein biosynthesis integral membrane protein MurJ [Gammaproteobacteria bacterium]MCW8841083.1 murein biosynthesis integral membrane protein MurJ [Gammaproteobacteria bacterium]MCW8927329.1 murein biosynthesis integral membrane protein MurJ [Gammaproteobacteria bacterium]MCW8957874.1 murein biosynthesis integral membrane protein MurJ [Gammaproteobacteria bacterium]MCW8973758.1 murein biosynthesis integral membrane protein MurJ [Gammaproteobacteria bacterium]